MLVINLISMDGLGRLLDGSPRALAQASTGVPRHKDMATYGRQPQVSLLSPTGVQAVLTTNGGIAKYLACASGSQSESVYHLYQELLRPS